MPSQVPNPDRIRRNATPGYIQLPGDGYKGKIPAFPLAKPSAAEREIWEDLWRTPQAVMWIKLGRGLNRIIARYVRNLTILESDRNASIAIAHLNGECRQIEDRLGLTPKAMLTMRWEVPTDELESLKYQRASSSRERASAVDEEVA